ncbi:hypothetical protein RM780_07635 [Streptomyces sp. DSM 44917]|uniref:TIGR04222 domain-containing membrane protein n=1 Tax=Streptomyces boetiae TaxID=3075541 RepID=A0ABU2L6F3_9ACTN|nr:hypothetical protein [Streptomyces sp. DSM 44917]MDT0306833.1 hypothetical protein [Streptomyces sp. DSM 44917]
MSGLAALAAALLLLWTWWCALREAELRAARPAPPAPRPEDVLTALAREYARRPGVTGHRLACLALAAREAAATSALGGHAQGPATIRDQHLAALLRAAVPGYTPYSLPGKVTAPRGGGITQATTPPAPARRGGR